MAEDGLRIGIVCGAAGLRQWQLQCLRELLEVSGVQITALIESDDAARTGRASLLYRWWLGRRSAPKALSPADGGALLNGLPRIACSGEAGALQKLQADCPDVLLQLSGEELPEKLRGLPRYGTWRFVTGGNAAIAGVPPGLRETLDEAPTVEASLQRLPQGAEKGSTLRHGCFKVEGRTLEAIAETVLACCAHWPAQACRAILAGGAEHGERTETGTGAAAIRPPTNMEMLRLLRDRLVGKRKSSTASDEEWNIGVLPHPIASLLEDDPSLNVRWLPAPAPGQGRASPFGFEQDGKLSVLYEKCDRSTGTSIIGRLRPKRDNNLKRSRVVLETDGLLSHPFTLEHEGAVHFVPEDPASGRVTLYRLDADQAGASPVAVLLQAPLCSPTLFRHGGRWWLFGTLPPLENTALYAYHAERLEGPYTPHLLNPVKTDVRSARPGGTPFRHGDARWRPARDHGHADGARIVLNRITELSPTAFAEKTEHAVPSMKTPWNQGIRTLAAVGGNTLVDGMRQRSGKRGGKLKKRKGKRGKPRKH